MRIIPVALPIFVFAVARVHGASIRQPDLKTAELLGRRLYEQSIDPTKISSPAFRKAREVAVAALLKLDPSKYHFEVVKNPAGDGLLVYALAYSNDADKVVLGVHYRVAVFEDGAKVQSIEPLSRSALVVSKSKGIPRGCNAGSALGHQPYQPDSTRDVCLSEPSAPRTDIRRRTRSYYLEGRRRAHLEGARSTLGFSKKSNRRWS
jgi:hypothetical protein